MTRKKNITKKLTSQWVCRPEDLEVSSAPAASAEPASAESSGPEPWPSPEGRAASVHNDRRLNLLHPPGPGHLNSRFLGRRCNLSSRPLLTGSEAIGLLLDEVDNGLIAVVEPVNRVLLTPHGITIFRADRDA